MKKLLIFDLDGTLANTLPDITDNLNLTLEKFGYPPLSERETLSFIGNGARKLVERALKGGVPDNFEEILNFYNDSYNFCGSPKTYAYEGMNELFSNLKKSGYMLAVLSNKPQAGTNEVIKRVFPEVDFSCVFGQREGVKMKPDGEVVNLILRETGISKSEAVLVGDSDVDVLTAKNAGIDEIAVLWGYRDKDMLQKTGATFFAVKPSDILQILSDM